MRFIDISGKKFNRWTVLEYAGFTDGLDKRRSWKCRCECGTIRVVAGTSLKLGKSKSCGCLGREISSKNTNNRIDMCGKRFGRLLVLKFAGHDKYKSALWEVKCDCGNIKILNGNYLRRGHTTSCGCYNLERSIEANTGKNNHQWKGGISLSDRKSVKYTKWRRKVIKRDKYKCQMCNRTLYKSLHAHHIFPFGDYEKLRFKV